MGIKVPDGLTRISLDVPSSVEVRVVNGQARILLVNGVSLIVRALDAPVGSRPLEETHAANAVIVTGDVTRPAAWSSFVRAILARLRDAAVPKERIIVVVAARLHQPVCPEKFPTLLDGDVPGAVRVECHGAGDTSGLAFIRHSSRGTPVWVHGAYLDAS